MTHVTACIEMISTRATTRPLRPHCSTKITPALLDCRELLKLPPSERPTFDFVYLDGAHEW